MISVKDDYVTTREIIETICDLVMADPNLSPKNRASIEMLRKGARKALARITFRAMVKQMSPIPTGLLAGK